MNKAEQTKLIYSGKYPLPLEAVTKKSYKILIYRSEEQSAEISGIKIPKLPDNYSVITSEDIKGSSNLVIGKGKIPVLANDKVNYIGEPILLIIGPEIEKLREIYKKIHVDYIKSRESKTLFFSKEVEIGNCDKTFNDSYKVVSGNIQTPARVVQGKLMHGAFTKRESDAFTIYSSTVWASDLKKNLSAVTKINEKKIKIITPLTTGDNVYNLVDTCRSAIYSTIASSQIKKNVIHYTTPEDQYLFSSKEYGLKCKWKAAYNESNEIQGIDIEVTLDCGAYPVMVKEKVYRIVYGLTSYYKQKNIRIAVNAVKSNHPPVDINNGLFLPEANFISEMVISKIIKNTKSDQYLWRRDNLLEKGFKSNTGAILKSNLPFKEMLNKIVHESDFSRKNSSINLTHIRKKRRIPLSSKRGIAISIGYNGNSYISNDKDLMSHSVTIQLKRGNKVDIIISTRLNNLKLLTVWEDIVSSTLGIEKENIELISDNSADTVETGPNFENKNISILTPLIKQCCEEIKVRRFKDPLPITQIKTTRRTSSVIWNSEEWKGDPFKNSSFGVCALELEIDRKSLETVIKEIWLELDVGHILSKSTLINKIDREITETINWLKESEPTLVNGKFSTQQFYNKTRIKSKPIVHLSFYESGKNRGKAKSAGSLIKTLLPGAYLQSVNQALGSNLNSFPITREMIYKELKKSEF